jgi:hypothetical protein
VGKGNCNFFPILAPLQPLRTEVKLISTLLKIVRVHTPCTPPAHDHSAFSLRACTPSLLFRKFRRQLNLHVLRHRRRSLFVFWMYFSTWSSQGVLEFLAFAPLVSLVPVYGGCELLKRYLRHLVPLLLFWYRRSLGVFTALTCSSLCCFLVVSGVS